MTILLYGTNNFLAKQKIQKITSRYQNLHKDSLNLQYFDFEEDTFEKFRDKLRTRSIFKGKKLFILRNIFANPLLEKKFLDIKQYISNSPDIVVFYVPFQKKEDSLQKNSFFIFLKNSNKSQEFKPLTQSKLKKWTQKEIEKYGRKISAPILNLFLSFTGNNMWRISTEIQKLTNFTHKEILEKDIKLLVKPEFKDSIFQTINFIASHKKKEALISVHKQLEQGESPGYILAMMAYQFRKLLIIKEQLLENKSVWQLRWKPFVIRKSFALSQKFTFEELKKVYQQIVQTDLDMKIGNIKPSIGIDLLVCQI